MIRIIAMCMLIFLAGMRESHSEEDAGGTAFAEAKVLMQQRWDVAVAKLHIVDGKEIAAAPDGTIFLGRDFINSFSNGLSPSDTKVALLFVMLHELVHVVQKTSIPEVSPNDPVRRPFECQADLLASFVMFSEAIKLAAPSGASGAMLGTEVLMRQLKQVGGYAEKVSGADINLEGHLDRRQRILAVQFGYENAIATYFNGKPEASADDIKTFETAVTFVGPHPQSAFEWSAAICKSITRSDSTSVQAASVDTLIDTKGTGVDFDKQMQNYNFSVKNTAAQTLAIHLIALSGSFPTGAKDDFSQYIFTGASHAFAEIPPHTEGKLTGSLPFPFNDRPEGIFVWMLPFDPDALISASYKGPAEPPPNCNTGWTSLRESPFEKMAVGLVRLGISSQNRFQSAMGAPLYPGLIASPTAFKSNIPVPGSELVTINITPSFNSASVQLYSGVSREDALKVYNDNEHSMRQLCNTQGVKFSSRKTASDEGSSFRVENLTGYSMAELSYWHSKPDAHDPNVSDHYNVYWYILPAGN